MNNKNSILLLMEVSDYEKSSEIFWYRIPFVFEDEESAIEAFYYLSANAKQCIQSAQFLKF